MLFYKDSKATIFNPIKLSEIRAIVMSPSNPMHAAFEVKDPARLGRSHIVFKSQNMGLLVRYLQQLALYELKVIFNDHFNMFVNGKPVAFRFSEITFSL